MTTLHTMTLADEAATEALGASLARLLTPLPGGVVWLHGTLGAGKTCLSRGWLRALGITGPIRSPTYTLIEPYTAAGREWLHLDLYRLKSPEELDGLGLDDWPPDRCWWLVEWPECAAGRLPAPTLAIRLRAQGAGRVAELDTAGLPPALRNAVHHLK